MENVMIRELCEKIGFPDDATEELMSALNKILACPCNAALLKKAQDTMYLGEANSFNEVLAELSEASGIHRYTVNMVFWLYCAIPLRYIYTQRGLGLDIYYDSLKDLRYKLYECKNVYGIWGTFVDWFKLFYLCKRFALGRLEYEKQSFVLDSYKDVLKKGDTVINMHIPSSGKLVPSEVIDSFKRAYEFFSDEVKDGVLTLHCDSWMLYTPMVEAVCDKGTNMRAFYEMFDIIETRVANGYPNFWRVYNIQYDEGAFDRAPTDTTLRKKLLEYLKNGGEMGACRGIIRFDGENILK